ncbi:hypothetical protein B0T16DRAFT_460225 [Cercophora newfieldiana]|uniref:AA1-like domain-containing protein n=1 Tax=Cercophora newfieldiana TaxID=92897 RepID=A0AA39Y2X6_9PEZI|nr:hypothetical protein B0T16DRAFT_460225 [Cercophora newfieldiana]
MKALPILALTAITAASPVKQLADCVIPSWSVHSASVTYSDDPFENPGTGSFTLTHQLTNVTEKIECSLAFNTACRVTGTPADPTLQWQFQVNIDFSWFVFNKTWTCDSQVADPKRPTFAYGYAEFTMQCPEEVTPNMTCTGLDAGSPLVVKGAIWTPPEVEPESEYGSEEIP